MPSSSLGGSSGGEASSSSSSEPCSWEKSPQSVSPTGPKDADDLWDSGQEWILIFDNLLKHPRGKTKGCKCDMCRFEKQETTTTTPVISALAANQDEFSSPGYFFNRSSSARSSARSLSSSSSPFHQHHYRPQQQQQVSSQPQQQQPDSGECPATTTGGSVGGVGGDDETEYQQQQQQQTQQQSRNFVKSRSSSVPSPTHRGLPFSRPQAAAAAGQQQSLLQGPAGAMDEESFIAAFEDVRRVNIFSARDLADELSCIRETLSKSSNDWKARVDALQHLRSLLIAGAANYQEMHNALRTLDVAFQVSVKDLRSQVVREACITIAYLSQQFHNKVDRFLEFLLQSLINLIPNSAKVMSTSGIVCVRFVIQNTFSPRFLPIITSNVSSKSREIRRHCVEFLDHLLHTWPTWCLEKHAGLLAEAIKRGIADADPDARQFARKAYWGFADHFREHADQLLNSLEVPYRRLLQAGGGGGNDIMSNFSSSNSTSGRNGISRSRQTSINGSNDNLDSARRFNTLGGRKSSSGSSSIPSLSSPVKPHNGSFSPTSPVVVTPVIAVASKRSNSAIDPSAARRANVRAQYAQRNRTQISGRPRKSLGGGIPDLASSIMYQSTQQQRSRGRMTVQSQPGSRSTSPTSLRAYQTYNMESAEKKNIWATASDSTPVSSRSRQPNLPPKRLNSPVESDPTTQIDPPEQAVTLEEKMTLLDMAGEAKAANGDVNGGDDDDDDFIAIEKMMEVLQSVKSQSQATERRDCMTALIKIVGEGKGTELIQENFRVILRLLLENLSDEAGSTRALVLGVLTEMLKQQELLKSFQPFTELVILKVLEAHKDEEKDVERSAEGCAAAMASSLPSDLVLRVLNPIIKTGDFPVNQAAIKMLTKMVEHPGNKEAVATHLADIMPGLLKSYDNVESSVRKASVFCIVSLYQTLGEELQSHLESLNGSKLKLLNLYIRRAQQQQQQQEQHVATAAVTAGCPLVTEL